jgi:hypothetical protein
MLFKRYNLQNIRKSRRTKTNTSLDTSFLLRIGNKITMEGVTEKSFGAETIGVQL